MELMCRFEEITPEIAKKYLAMSRGNRAESKMHIAKLSRSMLSDRFYPTTHGIGFTADGSLFDGHHRLRAVIESGKTITSVVVRGLPSEAIMVTDTDQKTRRAGDVLRMSHGVDNGNQVASLVRLICTLVKAHTFTLTTDEIMDVYLQGEEHIEWAIGLRPDHNCLGGAVIRGALAIARASNPARVDEFAQAFMDGSGDVGEPSRTLRDRILEKGGLSRGGNSERIANGRLILSAVNAHLRGDRNRKSFRADDDATERFCSKVLPWFASIQGFAAKP
jgi:hypothetical protein